jgi:hypothetical protein
MSPVYTPPPQGGRGAFPCDPSASVVWVKARYALPARSAEPTIEPRRGYVPWKARREHLTMMGKSQRVRHDRIAGSVIQRSSEF